MANNKENNQLWRNFFQKMMDLYISPEINKRKEESMLNDTFQLVAAQVIFFSDGRKPQVRLNSEARAIADVKLKPGVKKKVGEILRSNEIEGLQNIKLPDDEDPDCAHATFFRIENHWVIAFDFRYNKGLSQKHFEIAKQFLSMAENAYNKKLWAAFVDNLFSASELIVKAVLLSVPDPKFRKKTTHPSISMKFNRFSDLGNVKPEYRKIFNKLAGLRSCARYLKGKLSINQKQANELLSNVRNMMTDFKKDKRIRRINKKEVSMLE